MTNPGDFRWSVHAQKDRAQPDDSRPQAHSAHSEIDRIVRLVAGSQRLLVATDFDGAIARIVEVPERAVVDVVALDALRRLAWTPRTRSAIVSGRDLQDLSKRVTVFDGLLLVGSHGAEVGGQPASDVPVATRELLDSLSSRLELIAGSFGGARVEVKSRAVAFHYRLVEEGELKECLELVLALKEPYAGLKMRLGKMVVEFVADRVTKGDAIRHLKHKVNASAVVFIGDDLTDEDGFAALSAADAGVKVGLGDSAAAFRLADVAAVSTLLNDLAKARAAWLASL
jgi:trehalose 6-phosphate phosphatase